MMRLQSLVLAGTLATAALFLAASKSANADTVYDGNPVAFAAATYGVTTVGFPSPGYGLAAYEASPYGVGAVTFSYDESLSALYLLDAAYLAVNSDLPADPANYLIIFGVAERGFPYVDTLTINFPPSTAFGVEFSNSPPTWDDGFRITLSDGLSFYTLGYGFIGITSSSPLTSATFAFDDSPEYGSVEKVQYGSVVPEPSSLVLLGTGFLGLGWMICKKMA